MHMAATRLQRQIRIKGTARCGMAAILESTPVVAKVQALSARELRKPDPLALVPRPPNSSRVHRGRGGAHIHRQQREALGSNLFQLLSDADVEKPSALPKLAWGGAKRSSPNDVDPATVHRAEASNDCQQAKVLPSISTGQHGLPSPRMRRLKQAPTPDDPEFYVRELRQQHAIQLQDMQEGLELDDERIKDALMAQFGARTAWREKRKLRLERKQEREAQEKRLRQRELERIANPGRLQRNVRRDAREELEALDAVMGSQAIIRNEDAHRGRVYLEWARNLTALPASAIGVDI